MQKALVMNMKIWKTRPYVLELASAGYLHVSPISVYLDPLS